MIQLAPFHPTLESLDAELSTDALLTTKLILPVVRPGTVVRQRLIERLNAHSQRPLTLVAAPAGFGKTSLLSCWVRQSSLPVGWVALDEGDNDPVRFWSYVIAALDNAHPGIAAAPFAVLRSPQSAAIERALTLLLNALAGLSEPLLLVLDDCHTITAPLVYQTLTFVLDHLPPQLHLVLASRVNPPLPLARLRARGELAEIRADQLRFTIDEATALLRQTLALDIAAVDIATLIAKTEGWAAGLHLAGLSLQGQSDSTRFVASLRGSDRFILDYLVDEVLGQQPPAVQQFLLHTAVLERLNAELCDAVTGNELPMARDLDGAFATYHAAHITHSSQEMLEYLEQANLFTVSLDRERHWYRYHQLFAEFLRARLQRTQPELVAELHERAAAWYAGAGLPADAVGHALAIGDHAWAARLIEQAADSLMQRGEMATLTGWLGALPSEIVRARPRLCLVYALTLAASLNFDTVEAWLCAAEQAQDATVDDAEVAVAADLREEVNAVRAAVAALAGDVPRTMALARTMLTRLPLHNPFLQSTLATILALGYMWNEQVSADDRALIAAAVQEPIKAGALVTLRSAYGLASLWSLHGRLREATALYRQALPADAEPGQRPPPVVSLLYAGLSAVLWQQNDLEGAQRCALMSIELGQAWGQGRRLIDSLVMLARVQQARGDTSGAQATLAQAEQYGQQSHAFPWITAMLAATRAQFDLAQGELGAATRWAQTYERFTNAANTGTPVPTVRRTTADMILARVYIAQGQLAAARQLLATVRRTAEANEWCGVVIESLALESLALAALGDNDAAITSLAQALMLAEPEGYVRVFVDEGAPMGVLLAEVATTLQVSPRTLPVAVSLTYVESLRAALPPAATGAASPSPPVAAPVLSTSSPSLPATTEGLSERELEVLRLLAAGLSNHDVARTLVISVATVKTHIINIYSKLAVHSRTQAVARARVLRLVE